MVKKIKDMLKRTVIWAFVLGLTLTAFEGCNPREKVFIIGVANYPANQVPIFEGFKKGLAESGYVEGKNVKYIYYSKSLGNNDQMIYAEIKKLLSQNLDLLFVPFNESSITAKKAAEGTNTPVLSVGCQRPIEIGLIKSLNDPGWNVTGVQFANTICKGFEFLVEAKPDAKKIYLPYNIMNDIVSELQLNELKETASKMGIELVAQHVSSVEEALSAIENLPEDFDAIYEFPSRTLGPNSNELTDAAIKRCIPMGSGIPLDEDILITFSSDSLSMGRQAARLAVQILQGAKPADLPFETSETHLIINLKTAERIGFHIPNSLLAQATTIIR